MSAELLNSGDGSIQPRRVRRWLLFSIVAGLLLFAFSAAALLNHNSRVLGQTRSEFEASLNQSLAAAINYLDSRRMELVQYNPNCALTYMLRDMAGMTDDERLHALVNGYVDRFPGYYWLRMVFSEPGQLDTLQLAELPRGELGNLTDDQRWFYYVLGGTGIKLEDEELNLLMSPTDCTARQLTHQLFALNHMQHRNPDDADLKRLRMTLCDRIANEAAWELRVGDMLYQRIAFLLMAGRDDLINPRWVERMMGFQQTDGGWAYSYRPQVVEAVLGEQVASEHASVQAAWVLCQLKHRYPEWVERHYSN